MDCVTTAMGRSPLTLTLLAVASGVVCDRLMRCTVIGWALVAFLAAVASWFSQRFAGRSTMYLFLALAATGGAWHHLQWSVYSVREISRYARRTRQPAVLRLQAKTDALKLAHRRQRKTRYRVICRAQAIRDQLSWKRVRGIVAVELHGDVPPHVSAGDPLEVAGQLLSISPPTNPGSFDYRNHSRASRRLCRVIVQLPNGLLNIDRSPRGGSPVHSFRRQSLRALNKHFDSDVANLLAAMLIGVRGSVSQDQLVPFLVTGTVHLFSVSGLHVGILAGALWTIAHLLGLRARTTLLTIVLLVVFFALVCETRAPVTRAGVLVLTLCGSRWLGRPSFALNNLSAAGLAVIAWNPSQLLHAGTHLSFLAVAALGIVANWWTYQPPPDPLDKLVWHTRPWPLRVCRFCLWMLVRCWVVSLVVWCVTLPIVANQFHVVSIVGPLVQPFLWLPLVITLLSGFATVILDPILPAVASFLASVCTAGFQVMRFIIHQAAELSWSHFWSPGFYDVWVFVLYLMLLPLVWWMSAFCGRRSVAMMVVLVAVGTGLSHKPLMRRRSGELRCTVLDVRHGLAVVIEMPNGATLLYDCGSLGDSRLAASVVQQYLWHRGIQSIDALVISHADSDHYNSIVRFVQRTRVKRSVVAPQLLREPAVRGTIAALRRLGKVETYVADNLVHLDPTVQVTVLHPSRRFHGESDNANSLVLHIQFGLQSLLLAGDLEGSGLSRLLLLPPRKSSVVLSPHHGAPASNPPELMEWARPEALIVSGRTTARIDRLRWQISRLCRRIVVTGEVGAVTVTMTKEKMVLTSSSN